MILRCHNLFEAKALIKESQNAGTYLDLLGEDVELVIVSHSGEYLGTNRSDDAVRIYFDQGDYESIKKRNTR